MSDAVPDWMPDESVWSPHDGVRDSRRIYLDAGQRGFRQCSLAHVRAFVEMTAHLPGEWPVNGDLSVEFPTAYLKEQ